MLLKMLFFFLRKGAKLLVIACNSATSVAYSELEAYFKIPVIGVINPGANAAVAATKGRGIGVIGTSATIRSGAYQRAIAFLNPQVPIHSVPCPLFVPLAEEGWEGEDVCRLVAEKYLKPLKDVSVDTLVLGCTHYPLLSDVISSAMGDSVQLVDSAETAAAQVKEVLSADRYAESLGRFWQFTVLFK